MKQTLSIKEKKKLSGCLSCETIIFIFMKIIYAIKLSQPTCFFFFTKIMHIDNYLFYMNYPTKNFPYTNSIDIILVCHINLYNME